MSPVAPSPTADGPLTRGRDEEATLGRGELHELGPMRNRKGTYPVNGGTDGGNVSTSRTNVGTDGGLDDHQASGRDWRQALRDDEEEIVEFAHRFTGRGRWVPWTTSVVNIARSSVLNFLLILTPIAWVSHFAKWNPNITFTLCFLSIIPLEKLFDFGGEQMEFYLGRDLGELLVITLNNAVEASLAIILLIKCDLKLLQSTVTGVIILHLLLVPGTAFLTGGARIWEQNLHPHPTQLNHSLLTIGVLSILLPTAFFAAIDRGVAEVSLDGLISDPMRHEFLKMSRGLAIILLIMYVPAYIGSRIYLHNPPGEDNALRVADNAPEAIKKIERELATGRPKVNVWTCLVMLAITIGIMATTAEWLVESIEHVREGARIQEPWFGIILLPLVSFAADGAVASLFFGRYALRLFFGTPPPPAELAKGRAIDLSIQFVLFWLPFLVLLGWWTDHPMHMLFDYYEVALLLGACFLVNYVTADSKTNWVEGLIMVCFYAMIALVTWWYPGQESAKLMLKCYSLLAPGGEGGAEGEGAGTGEGEGGEVAELAVRMAVRAAAQLMK